MAGIKDVAKLAGVNQAIVSRVVNNDKTLAIRDSTRERVLWAIEELDYRPDMLGRNLRARSTQTLGAFIPNIINPYFSELLMGVESAAQERDYNVVFFHTDESPQKETALIRTALEYHVDGFIIASATLKNNLLEVLDEKQKPYVLVHRKFDGSSGSYIGADDEKGIRLAVEHLAGLGHRRIAYVSDKDNTFSGQQRKNTFIRTMRQLGLPIPDEYIVSGGNRLDDGYSAASMLLERELPPTAIMNYNDILAVGAINAALTRGLRIPEDISIVGFDDIWMAAQMHPPLTTVRVSIKELGYTATNILLSMLKNPGVNKQEVIADVKLVVRKSTGPCK